MAKLSNNYLLSEGDQKTLTNYLDEVKSTTKIIKGVSDLTVIMKKYEEDIRTHDNKVYELTNTIESKDNQIKELSTELNETKNIVVKQKEKIGFLEKQVSYF